MLVLVVVVVGMVSTRSPNSARPTRTIVAPSSIAISKSSLIPIDSSGPISGHRERQPSASSRRPANVRRASSGS